MATIVKRGHRYYVVYKYKDHDGNLKQKWESYKTMPEAKARRKEIDYKSDIGTFIVPQCKTMNDLLKEYVALYGRNKWAMSTYSGNVAIIEHYIVPILGTMKLALHLTFTCSLRIGELLGLTWDCVDVSEESIISGKASITIWSLPDRWDCRQRYRRLRTNSGS